MEYSQFDDFIKSNTKDELSAPEELSWDNMNFSLPPAKRKRRILPWLLLLLLGVGLTISLIGYTYYQNSNGIGSNSLGNSVSIERQNRGVDAEAGYSDQCEEPFRAITTDDVSTDFETESSPSTRTVHYTRTMSGNRKQQTTVSGGTQYKDTPTPAPSKEIAPDKKVVSDPLLEPNDIAPEMSGISTILENSHAADGQKSNQFAVEALPMRPLWSDLRMEYIPARSIEQLPEPSLAEQEDARVKQENKPKFLVLSMGMNTAQLDHSSAILKDAQASEWGSRYQVSLEQTLKSNWLVGVGLAYHTIHSTFTFDKDLGTYINFSEGFVMRQTRHVFQNNYFEFISLNVGLSKQFNLKSRWYTQVLINFSPSYRLRHTGKLVDDTGAIIDLSPGTISQNKWIWNAEAGLSVSYRLKAVDVFGGVNISQALTPIPLFLNNNDMTIQPRMYSINLGIRRAL